jgi:hypothetical protein
VKTVTATLGRVSSIRIPKAARGLLCPAAVVSDACIIEDFEIRYTDPRLGKPRKRYFSLQGLLVYSFAFRFLGKKWRCWTTCDVEQGLM